MKRCKTCSCRPCCCEEFGRRCHVCVYGRECWCGAGARTPLARSHTKACWPMTSEALSCHPAQVREITERNKRHGITGVSYLPDGTCVVADRGARRQLLALEGKFDKEGGYGDDHAGQSPLYRTDSVPFDDTLLRERSAYGDGRRRDH